MAYERFKFYSRKQAADEPVDKFISDLRTLARFCNFVEDGKNFSHHMIRDRVVCGVSDDALRRKLLSKGELSLENA